MSFEVWTVVGKGRLGGWERTEGSVDGRSAGAFGAMIGFEGVGKREEESMEGMVLRR